MMLLSILNDEALKEGLTALARISSKIGWRLLVDMLTVLVLVRFIYYPNYKHKDLFFTFFIFNLIIFLISFLLNKVELSMGAAFGLFAVFSMLRYRTEDISIKDMTYLFLVIAIGLLSAVAKVKGADDLFEYLFIALVNSMILLITFLLESKLLMRKESTKLIFYENIELIQTGREAELLEDMSKRTGTKIHRYDIQRVDFLRDSAQIKIYYYD